MANLKEIRKSIGSVKNTQKITRAMKLVASARLRKAKIEIEELRPYALKTFDVLSAVSARASEEDDETLHPLLEVRPAQHVMLVVLTSDRGLAGSFNASICKEAETLWAKLEGEGANVSFTVIGRKGRDYFRRRGANIRHDFTEVFANLDFEHAGEIGRQIVSEYTDPDQELDAVYLVYNEFKNAITQIIRSERILPIQPATLPEGQLGDFIYEPNKTELLNRLLPMYVDTEVFRALLESVASEHGARMTAMDNATTNASKMIKKLTLQYNRARQAAITTELMEIIGGAEALK